MKSIPRRPIKNSGYRFLFEREDVVVEELVQLLVGVVDAQLLERVLLEVLEPEDVEDADERLHVFACSGIGHI
jgi:hypothetical protein